ncbi:sulfite exporter TauE/SafE family protein [Azoarcus sp. L1K30]|uniref:sulfite exporter TauE/SafE family protein n=1 Tax=Azoarcus sp. L1K30 TaxID=2820277 RepID=UPI001B823C1C|nr:sulfite exporter TauE/SafE family protein [Azoarcus sp. L1K30]
MTIWLFAYPLLGVFSGFFAGLLGIGGGAVMVPILAMLFTAQGFAHEQVMHLALGTSMATILFTSVASLRTHHQHGAVDWGVVARMTPGILVGTLAGAALARVIDTRSLAVMFTLFILANAAYMIADRKPPASHRLPGMPGLSTVGLGIGAVSSLVAIGGAALSVPYMTWCNVRMQRAIGTAAAIGFPIALGGSVGYVINGRLVPGLPEYSLGYIYLPALAGLVLAGMAMAPVGARFAHRVSVKSLKRVFAGVLVVLALKMLLGMTG